LDADLISTEPIDPGLLEDVGRITNSIVRPSGRQVWTSPLHPSSRGIIGN
jgi:hypothetical protein